MLNLAIEWYVNALDFSGCMVIANGALGCIMAFVVTDA